MSHRAMIAPPGSELTDRELEVVEAYRRLGTYGAVAIALDIAEPTVKEHLSNARSRRGVRRTWQLFANNLDASTKGLAARD